MTLRPLALDVTAESAPGADAHGARNARVALVLASLPIWLVAASFPWPLVSPEWLGGFAAFAILAWWLPPAQAVAALVAALALTGNPAMRGRVATAASIDVLVGITLMRLAARPIPAEIPRRPGWRSVEGWLAVLFLAMVGSWLANLTGEFDVLSGPFRADWVDHLRQLSRLADQADPFFGLRRLLDLYEACVIGALAARLVARGPSQAPALTAALGLAVAVAVGVGGVQALTGWAVAPFGRQLPDGTWQEVRRVNGTAPDANGFAALLLLCGPVAFAWLERAGKRAHRLIRWPLVLGWVGAWVTVLVMTGSRAAFVGVGAQALWVAAQRVPWRGVARAVAMGSLILIGVGTAVRWAPADWLPANPTVARFVGLARGEGLARALVTGRITLWRAAFAAWATRPIVGVGPGNLYRTMPRVWPALRAPSAAPLRNAHNQFLQMAAEGGPVALGLFLVLAARVFARLTRRGAREAAAWPERALATGLVGEGVMAAVGHPLLNAEHLAVVMAILGYGLGLAPVAVAGSTADRRASMGRWSTVGALGGLAYGAVVVGLVARNVARPPPVAVHGAYPEEWTPSGQPFRWLGPQARLVVNGRELRAVRVEVSAAEPDLAERPVVLESITRGSEGASARLPDGASRDLMIALPARSARGTEIELRCDRTFRPCDVWPTPDCRELCVRLWNAAP